MSRRVSLPPEADTDIGLPNAYPFLAPKFGAAIYGVMPTSGPESLDEVTKELSRLRNARDTRCTACLNLRSAEAVEQGMTEADVASVLTSTGSELPAATRAAVAYTGAMLVSGRVPESLREQMLANFTPAQIVDLTLWVLVNRFAKVNVALGLEPDTMSRTVYDRRFDVPQVVPEPSTA